MNETQRRARNFAFHAIVPLNNKIGLAIDLLDSGLAHTTLPANPELADAEGNLHTGTLSIILDTTAGMAAFMSLDTLMPFATLNMRIDHHHPARIDAPITIVANLHTKGTPVITIHATATQRGREVATAVVTFMLGTPIADPTKRPAWLAVQ